MEKECEYNKSLKLIEKEFKLFRYKKVYFDIVKVENHAIELACETKWIKNQGHFEIYSYIALFKISFILNMHDVRVGV
jgi:hypothetical protein